MPGIERDGEEDMRRGDGSGVTFGSGCSGGAGSAIAGEVPATGAGASTTVSRTAPRAGERRHSHAAATATSRHGIPDTSQPAVTPPPKTTLLTSKLPIGVVPTKTIV